MRKVRKSIDLLFFAYHGLVGVLVGILLMLLASFVASGAPVIKEFLNAIGSTLIVGAIFGLLYTNLSRNIYYEDVKYLVDREESGFRQLYPQSGDPEVIAQIVGQLRTAKDVRMFGIAVNLLWKADILNLLRENAMARKTRVVALLADVNSAQIETRLTEEEDADVPNSAGKSYITGLVKRLREIEQGVNDPAYFDLRLFSHYPTFAMIIIDDDIYVYPYGYKTLGTTGPMLYLKGFNSPQARYYRRQFDLLLRDYRR